MYLQVHPVHRRLAELTLKAHCIGGYDNLSQEERTEIEHCLQVNLSMIERLDQLKQLSFQAHLTNDFEWEQELSGQIDELVKSWK